MKNTNIDVIYSKFTAEVKAAQSEFPMIQTYMLILVSYDGIGA